MKGLAAIKVLKENWDSYGGLPATAEAIDTAEWFCAVPMSDGGIQVEVHAGGKDVEIEIAPSGKITSVFVGEDEEEKKNG